MSDFNPEINSTSTSNQTGYGRIFCNYPKRRADEAINRGMESYHFSTVKDTHVPQSLDPRAQVRNNGVMNSYSKGSPITAIPHYAAPYENEGEVQDRGIPLNRDTKSHTLESAPSTSQVMPVVTTLRADGGMPKVSVPNPNIPVYNHLIPFEAVENFAKCPCADKRFQTVEHVWANGTRVKGYDPRLYASSSEKYQKAIQQGRSFPYKNVKTCN